MQLESLVEFVLHRHNTFVKEVLEFLEFKGAFYFFLHLLVHLVELVGPVDIVIVAFLKGDKGGHDRGVDILSSVSIRGEVM